VVVVSSSGVMCDETIGGTLRFSIEITFKNIMKASTETILSIFGKLIQFGEKLYVIFN
jgi:hypothetical protein